MTPAQSIAVLLAKFNYGTKPSAGNKFPWPIYISAMPEQSAAAIAIYDTTGVGDGRLMGGESIIHPGIQVKVRAKDYPTGWAKAEAIGRFLDTIYNQQIEGVEDVLYTVFAVHRRPTIALGSELEGTRQQFTINAVMSWTDNLPRLSTTEPVSALTYLEINP